MIKKLAKFFCMMPLLVAVAGASMVSSSEANPPSDELREQADDCIEKIREKQRKIQQEIDLIKDMIRRKDQNPTLPKNQNR